MLPGLPLGTVKLDCGTCQKCCQGSAFIVLVEGEDNPHHFDCYEHEPGMWVLKRQRNGDCVYLGPQGCTIHGRHPAICRVFDCAAFVQRMDKGGFDLVGPRVDNAVVAEGRRRLALREGAK